MVKKLGLYPVHAAFTLQLQTSVVDGLVSVIFVLIYLLVLVFQLFFSFSFVLVLQYLFVFVLVVSYF